MQSRKTLIAAGLIAILAAGTVAFAPLPGKGKVVQSVTGAGQFTDGGGDFRTFAFTARRYADGSVAGQWERVNHRGNAKSTKSHGVVTCFTVVGNKAWLSGFATSGRFSTPPFNNVAWRVVDNGQGKNSPADQMSLQFVGTSATFAANYCANLPTFQTLFDTKGNIQVR